MPTVRSFDVFDTVLTRSVGAPGEVATVVAERVTNAEDLPFTPGVFAASRRRHEWQLTTLLGRHATLREIYAAVAKALSIGESHVEGWAALEEAVERELTLPLPGARERIERARHSGPVIFVSDTPHSEQFIKELLQKHELAILQDRVYTSSDRAVSKAHGGLFELVASDFGHHYRFLHQGDNERSDVVAARAEGWGGTHTPDGQLSRYELLLEEHSKDTAMLTTWLAGASRLARLESIQRGTPTAIAEVASGALAPLLVGFALWVVAQARERGVSRLYYVARDGEAMLQAANHVLTAIAPDIELRFLYGSRKPWIFAASASSDEVLAEWVRARPGYTARTVLTRVDLAPEQVYAVTGLASCHPNEADRPLVPDERSALASALLRPPLIGLVRAGAERVREQTLAYFRQEGLTQQASVALVDAGWGGWTAYAFDQLIQTAGGRQVDHFLMGIRGSRDDLARRQRSRLMPWLLDEQTSPSSIQLLPMVHTLVEVLCAGTMGRTLSYESRGDAVQPVLSSRENEPVVAWGLQEVQRTAERVAELVASRVTELHCHVDAAPAVIDVLRAFWLEPTDAEARAWGSFPWEEEIWPPNSPLAQRLTTRDVWNHLRQGDLRIRRVNSWRAGSAIVSSQPWSTVLRVRGWQIENKQRFLRVPRRLKLEIAQRCHRSST